MKEDQKDSNKKTTSNPKDEQNKELFTKHPAPKKYRNKSVNKYKVNINPNIKRNLINNNLNLLGSLGIDKNVQDLIVNQNKNLNYNNNVPNMPARKRTKTMHLKNQNNINKG
jgi:hypothetical protein